MARVTATITAFLISASLISAIDAGEPNVSRLLELLDQTTFTALGEQDVELSRQAVLASIKGIPKELIPREEDEDDYLETQAISNALIENAKDKTEVPNEEVVGRLQNLIEGLEKDTADNDHPELLKLREVARHHIMVVADHQDEKLAASFAERKADLQKALREYAQDPSAQQRRIAAHIRWCQQHGQALKFVAAARQELSSPNLEIRLSADFIREASLRPFEQSEPVNRNSDGIQTRGTSDFRGQGFLRPTNSPGNGMLALEFQGEMQFFATSTRKRIQFGSHATTSTTVSGYLIFDNQGYLTASVPHARACTNLRNCPASVSGRCCLGKRMIGRLADRVIAKKTPELEVELSNEVVDRVQKEMKKQLEELVGNANAVVRDKFKKRAIRLDLNPREIIAQTTDAELRLGLIEDIECGLAAPGRYTGPSTGPTFAAIHQSLATDLLNRVYVRRIGSESIDVNSMHRLLNEAHPSVKFYKDDVKDFDDPELELELDFPRPLEVTFQPDVIRLTFRAKEVQLNGASHGAHDLSLDYRVSLQPGGNIKLEFQGSQLTPVDSENEKADPELVEAIENELLLDLLPRLELNPDELKPDDMELPFEMSSLTVEQGWLATSLSKQQKSASSEQKSGNQFAAAPSKRDLDKSPVERSVDSPARTLVIDVPPATRVWKDRTEKYSRVGRLVDLQDGIVRIMKENGRYSTVALTDLCDNDRWYVDQHTKLLENRVAQIVPTDR